MLRFILVLIGIILLISVVRMVVGVALKTLAGLMAPAQEQRQSTREVPIGGELKRDPVCGTYVSAVSSLKKTVQGQTLHFCSDECRNKYAG